MPNQTRELFMSILAWCHRKGCLVKKNLAKAKKYLDQLELKHTAGNVLFQRARIMEKLGKKDVA